MTAMKLYSHYMEIIDSYQETFVIYFFFKLILFFMTQLLIFYLNLKFYQFTFLSWQMYNHAVFSCVEELLLQLVQTDLKCNI